ncbi:protein FMC1 homolog [Ruditapes philippinarum]|uniref:protein FMC1 homolog n=1 Tax=Ruditapes philippinarum TaxID=129788 RepID=UPI00295B980B|nr:protein FMC1 homolog [Ruditapes philippinarum]
MAASREILTLYRTLLRELRAVYPKDKLTESPAYQHVRKQFREHRVTTEKLCRSKVEMEYLARTYLCFLQSVKQHEELHSAYKGAGERSIESAANLVGLKLPELPDEQD